MILRIAKKSEASPPRTRTVGGQGLPFRSEVIRPTRAVLALFAVISLISIAAIGSAALFPWRMAEAMLDSVERNRAIADLVDDLNGLAAVASDVNAPGNDVFESRDIPKERSALERTLGRFRRSTIEIRAALAKLENDHRTRAQVADHIGAAEVSLEEECLFAAEIFDGIEKGEIDLAGAAMAKMDRAHALVLHHLSLAFDELRGIQHESLTQQSHASAREQRAATTIAIGAAAVIVVILLFGTLAARRCGDHAADMLDMLAAAEAAADDAERARRAAEESSRAKSAFLANMSHEIRTPMNGVLGTASLLARTRLTTEQRDLLSTIQDCSDGLLVIINDILDFSKIEAGKMKLESIPFDPVKATDEVGELLGTEAYAKGLEFVVDVAKDVPRAVVGDPYRLRQVLLNLAKNAVKFTHTGQVVVRLESEPIAPGRSLLRFSVEDTGIGISAEDLRRLFHSFSQVDSSTVRRAGGTGLGLAISKQLVELMGSEISVTSRPNVGSVFSFALEFAHASLDLPEASTPRNFFKILVVDGHGPSRSAARNRAEALGFATKDCAGTAEAIATAATAAAADSPFDFIFLDHALSDGGPGSCPTAFDRSSVGRSTKVILCAPASTTIDFDDAIGLGFDGLVLKPLSGHRILHAIDRALEGRSSTETVPLPVASEPNDVARRRILVVDDNAVNRMVASKMLERLGFDVDHATTGIEAVDASAAYPYDLVLMDCQMPEMDGFEATRAIRAREIDGAKRTTIIALTAEAMNGDEDLCLDAGMDGYLSKPIRIDDLGRVLDPLFGRSDADPAN